MLSALFITFLITIAALYVLLIMLYCIGWHRSGEYVIADGARLTTPVAVIIPARNEEANIAACVRSLLAQEYPSGLLQILVVDDCSEDDTAAIAASFDAPVQCIRMADILKNGEQINAYKKKALSIGIAAADGAELIITTDADCILPPLWLRHIVNLYEKTNAAMIAAPVDFSTDASMVQLFQSLDFMTMQGITVAAHRLKLGGMANGANLAFSRTAYDAVRGYEGTEHLASGDDYLLLAKMQQRFSESIYYLKAQSAIVRTGPQPDWGSFLQQRIRWASKSGKYDDKRLTGILIIVYLFNVSLLAAGICACFNSNIAKLLLILLVVKIIAELVFLFPVASFFRKRKQLILFPFLQPLHIIYIVLAGFLGMIGNYQWKGRRVS